MRKLVRKLNCALPAFFLLAQFAFVQFTFFLAAQFAFELLRSFFFSIAEFAFAHCYLKFNCALNLL